MRGTAYEGAGRLRTVTVPVEEPGPGELQIAVAYCGLCGTDLHGLGRSFEAQAVDFADRGAVLALGNDLAGRALTGQFPAVSHMLFGETTRSPARRSQSLS